MLSESIAKLVQYGITTGLTLECERNYTTNLLLYVFHEDDYEKPDNIEEPVNLEATLGELLDEAVKRGLIEDSIVYRNLFDTRLMDCLPSTFDPSLHDTCGYNCCPDSAYKNNQ